MPADLPTAGSETPLRMLALETSGQAGSVAAFASDNLISERWLDSSRRSAQSLAPAIRDLLNELSWRPADIRVVAVTTGPGSFTGLRVGVTTAKTFAYAVGADVIGVNTLEAIVQRAAPASGRIWAIIDAQRGEVYSGLFSLDSVGLWEALGPTTIVSRDAWLGGLPAGDVITGPALGSLLGRVPRDVIALPASAWLPTAESVGRLASRKYAGGERDSVWALSPQYYRRSAAEEKSDRERPVG